MKNYTPEQYENECRRIGAGGRYENEGIPVGGREFVCCTLFKCTLLLDTDEPPTAFLNCVLEDCEFVGNAWPEFLTSRHVEGAPIAWNQHVVGWGSVFIHHARKLNVKASPGGKV